MMQTNPFDLASAQTAAQVRQLESWIHAYLTAGDWANLALSDGLKMQQRWWRGPVEVALDAVVRCCGPEPEMEFRMETAAWNARVDALARSFTTVEALPPLITEYRSGLLSVRDGNHRHEAIRRKGWGTCWTVVWYNSAADFMVDGHRFE
jgi:hypothetical protein